MATLYIFAYRASMANPQEDGESFVPKTDFGASVGDRVNGKAQIAPSKKLENSSRSSTENEKRRAGLRWKIVSAVGIVCVFGGSVFARIQYHSYVCNKAAQGASESIYTLEGRTDFLEICRQTGSPKLALYVVRSEYFAKDASRSSSAAASRSDEYIADAIEKVQSDIDGIEVDVSLILNELYR